jgi:hypothetical protein
VSAPAADDAARQPLRGSGGQRGGGGARRDAMQWEPEQASRSVTPPGRRPPSRSDPAATSSFPSIGSRPGASSHSHSSPM